MPNLEAALTLEIVFDAPVSKLFEGVAGQAQEDVRRRARTLLEAMPDEASPDFAKKVELLGRLARLDDVTIVPLWPDDE